LIWGGIGREKKRGVRQERKKQEDERTIVARRSWGSPYIETGVTDTGRGLGSKRKKVHGRPRVRTRKKQVKFFLLKGDRLDRKKKGKLRGGPALQGEASGKKRLKKISLMGSGKGEKGHFMVQLTKAGGKVGSRFQRAQR